MNDSVVDRNQLVISFMQKMVESLTPFVTEEVARCGSGNFELHYTKGQFMPHATKQHRTL